MKAFELHEDTGDTAADAKTNELHAFLHPICNGGTPHDFEGSNSGLTIWFNVTPGDTMIQRADGSLRVLEKGAKVVIDRVSFPRVFEAFLAVEYDNGAHHVNRIAVESGGDYKVDLTKFEMPYEYGIDKLCRAENALDSLASMRGTPDHIENFACGEQGEIEELIKLLAPKIPDLQVAHDLINDWFNAWEKS